MNKYVKQFLFRGLIFAGFGPIITSLVILCINKSGVSVTFSAAEMFIAIISTYVLAFVQAGATVFNQIEDWPITKSLFFNFLSIYLVYVGCYLINSWIPFDINFILFFTLIFVLVYLVIWFTVYICVKCFTKKLNEKLK